MIIERIFLMGIPIEKIKEIYSENPYKDLINLTPEILNVYPEKEYFKYSEIKDNLMDIIQNE